MWKEDTKNDSGDTKYMMGKAREEGGEEEGEKEGEKEGEEGEEEASCILGNEFKLTTVK